MTRCIAPYWHPLDYSTRVKRPDARPAVLPTPANIALYSEEFGAPWTPCPDALRNSRTQVRSRFRWFVGVFMEFLDA